MSTMMIRRRRVAGTGVEVALTDHDAPAGRIGRFLKASPSAVRCLQYLGVDAVTSANNHALDFGAAGLSECGEILRRAEIGWCGVVFAGMAACGSVAERCVPSGGNQILQTPDSVIFLDDFAHLCRVVPTDGYPRGLAIASIGTARGESALP